MDNKKNHNGVIGKWLRDHSNEIQSLCSLASVIIIGIFGLVLTIQSNKIAELQLQVSANSYNPVVTWEINSDEEQGVDTVSLYNNGAAMNYPKIEIISFFDFYCNENYFGDIPIRVYTFNDYSDYEIYPNTIGQIAQICFHNKFYSTIQEMENGIEGIIDQYTDLYWDVIYTHLIIIKSTDVIGNEHELYFVCSKSKVKSVSPQEGQSIYNEKNAMIDQGNGLYRGVEKLFMLDSSTPDSIFRYALEKIRDKNLYRQDFATNEFITYGEYEPNEKKEDTMTNSTDIIAILISIIALGITLFTWIFSYKQNKYEYKSVQETKSDLLRLIAALKSISRKAMYSHLITNGAVDISNEKHIIQDFLSSDTWLIIQKVMPEDDILMFYSRIMIILYQDTDIRYIGLFSKLAMEHITEVCQKHIRKIDKAKNKFSENLDDYTSLDQTTNDFYNKVAEQFESKKPSDDKQ